MKWIDTINLRNWADRRDCQDQIPLLIRKLIRATSGNIKNISFPAGENVLIGGWDGILEVYDETEYLPLGLSLWEFGTNKNIKGKADGEYEKRKAEPLGFNPSEVCFIFLTPRLWTKKEEWIAEKKADDYWKDVKAYDAQDLEEWIELAPSVGAWLAVTHLHILPQSVQAVDDFWEEWATGNQIRFLPEVVLAGREKEAKKLIEESKQPAIIPVKASSRDEAIAFIAATYKDNDSISEDFFAKALIIDSASSFREAMIVDKPLYLIVRFNDDNIVNRARDNGHVVYLPIEIDNSGQWSDLIVLPALERDAFLAALVKSGLALDRAEKISLRTARNLSVLRRQLEFNRLIPEWSRSETVRELIPAMIVERWDENLEGDKKIIESIAGEPYNVYIGKLKKWLYTSDAPIVQIGSTWRLTSPLDAWTNAGKYCTREDFEKLRLTFLEVFSLPDPKFILAPEDRQRASWYGINKVHSKWVREGLAQTIILISVYGDNIYLDLPTSPESWVDHNISVLLANTSSDVWKSLNTELPLIAEASPASFIGRLEDLIKTNNGPIYQLFEEEKGLLYNNSYHTGLLWALENLAWMPEYLTRTTLILANLATNDPGGSIANRPINTLRDIFKSWSPQTLGSLDDRFTALTIMVKKYKAIGQTIIQSMLPQQHDIANRTHRMRWRLSDETIPQGVSYDELFNTYTRAIGLLIELFDDTEDAYNELMKKSFKLNSTDRDHLLDFLEKRLEKVEHIQHKTWHTLRNLVGKHRTYPNSNWSLSEDVLVRYQKIYDRLTPADPIDQTSWLLTEHWPELIDGKIGMLGVKEKEILYHDKKKVAVQALYEHYGLDKLLEIAYNLSGVELQSLAAAVGDVISNEQHLHKIWGGLKTDDQRRDFAQYIVEWKRRLNGNEYVFNLYGKLESSGFETKALSNIFLRIYADRQIWEFIDSTNQDLINDYWTRIDPIYFYLPAAEISTAVSRLMKYRRFASAVHMAYNIADQLDGSLLIEVLMNFISNPSENDRPNIYEIEYLFKELRKKESASRDALIKLEWLYLPIFDRGIVHGNTPVLHQEMADNPKFFVEVLEQLYNTETDDQEESELTTDQRQLKIMTANSAYKLFNSWNIIPGTDKEMRIDQDKLKNWINQVQELARESDRLSFAEAKIGAVFAKYPETNQEMNPEKELNWPPDVLCEIMEEFNSKPLFDEFRAGTYNKRGSSSRSPFAGGGREWHIANYFKKLARLKAPRFPHVAAIMEDLSKHYELEAKQEDERAERDRLEY